MKSAINTLVFFLRRFLPVGEIRDVFRNGGLFSEGWRKNMYKHLFVKINSRITSYLNSLSDRAIDIALGIESSSTINSIDIEFLSSLVDLVSWMISIMSIEDITIFIQFLAQDSQRSREIKLCPKKMLVVGYLFLFSDFP
jgi:hypothetical protein